MNEDAGIYQLTSGNSIAWRHVRRLDRGTVQGEFTAPPTDADVAEARAFFESRAPDRAAVVVQGMGSRQQCEAVADMHLNGGGRN